MVPAESGIGAEILDIPAGIYHSCFQGGVIADQEKIPGTFPGYTKEQHK